MNLSEIRQLLARHNLRLTRSLGQNFLHDGNQLQRMVCAAALQPGEQVLEIGPGLGPLTELLLAQSVHVLAVEIDRRLFEILQTRFANLPRLTLHHGDALEFLRAKAHDWSDWKLVSNLPYSCASPILVELALHPRGPRQMTVTLQWEVAQRLMAKPATEAYGVLTLLLQLDYTLTDWFKIPATCFFPVPGVDSACVTLQRRPAPLLSEAERRSYVQIVKQGFSQRRKKLLKLLAAAWPAVQWAEAVAALPLPPTVRAEELSLDHYLQLARHLSGDGTCL